MHIIVTGGEPLVRSDIYEIFRVIRSHDMAITLYSNGHLIDSSVAARLRQFIGVVELTVLAGDPTIHLAIPSPRRV